MRIIKSSFKKNDTLRNVNLFFILIIIALFVGVLGICIGSVRYSISEVINSLFTEQGMEGVASTVLLKIRLPRVIAALLGGACLATAGVLLQVFFKNPIVDSHVLGVSSGSILFVAILMLSGFSFGIISFTPFVVLVAAFIGAMLVTIIMLLFSIKIKSSTTLLIIGIMVGYLCSSATGLLSTFADQQKLKGFIMWTMGSFAGITMKEAIMLCYVSIPLLILAFLLSKTLNVFVLGEDYAKSMGVNIKWFRITAIIISSGLTAFITSIAGPIAFIGISVPHIARIIFRTSNNTVVIPASILLGAIITEACDIIARTLFSPIELMISTVTSFFGVPLVIYLLLKKRKITE